MKVSRLIAGILVAVSSSAATFCAEIHEAAARGDLHEIASLLAAGTDVNSRTEKGETPLMIASSLGYQEIVQLLLAKGGDANAMTTATLINVLQLGEYSPDKAEIYPTGARALHFAATHGHAGIAQLLLAKGAEINAPDDDNATALMDACAYGRKEVVQVLLANKADFSPRTKEGLTALDLANRNGYPEIVKLLEDAGASSPRPGLRQPGA
jgi:uncharacterized protein